MTAFAGIIQCPFWGSSLRVFVFMVPDFRLRDTSCSVTKEEGRMRCVAFYDIYNCGPEPFDTTSEKK